MKEVWGIISHYYSRFEFNGNVGATIFRVVHFQILSNASNQDCRKCCQIICGTKLHSELSLTYSRPELKHFCGAVPLLKLLIESNLGEAFSETLLLLKTIITIRMSPCGAQKFFSTLKRVKRFLRNTMSVDRLNASAMLSMKRSLFEIQVTSIKM